MFVVLDTNHVRELVHESPAGLRLRRRLIDAGADAFTTIVTVREIFQGWSAEINRHRAGRDQVDAYAQFHTALRALEHFTVLPFDDESALHFHGFRERFRRAGTMDLKIAAIAVSHGALLLTRNLRDFEALPGLRVENWLE